MDEDSWKSRRERQKKGLAETTWGWWIFLGAAIHKKCSKSEIADDLQVVRWAEAVLGNSSSQRWPICWEFGEIVAPYSKLTEIWIDMIWSVNIHKHHPVLVWISSIKSQFLIHRYQYQLGPWTSPFFYVVFRGLSAAYSLGQVGARQAWLDWLFGGLTCQLGHRLLSLLGIIALRKDGANMHFQIQIR